VTKEEIHAVIAEIAGEVQEMHSVLAADMPKDEEGFPIPDGSDLSDALQMLDRTVSRLSRLAHKIAQEG
jgi:hypothetical protein